MRVASRHPEEDDIGVVDLVKRLVRILALAALFFLVDVSGAQGDTVPDSAYISGVNGHAQKHSLSCEARSAADLATFWGIRIGENEFLEALPQSDNPDSGFVGDPNDTWGSIPPHGYGVYAGPVAETLRTFGLQAEAHDNLSWDDLRTEIHGGRPVIVWVIGQMWGGTSLSYTAPDGSTSRVAYYEHTMILTGYNWDTVQVVDAYSGQYQTYLLSTFLHSWAVLGNMAVFTSPVTVEAADAPVETHTDTYTVQRGDYLIALAERFGTSWEKLSDLNSIGYPYVIQPGQVLQLPGGEEQQTVSDAAEPAPTSKTVNFIVRLPMVQRMTQPDVLPSQ
jgi:uncharacterized protein YvpB